MTIPVIKADIPEQKFNKQKYIKNIKELIMEMYDVDKEAAMVAINRSGLINSLEVSPVLTTHISDEDWAEKIWNGYQQHKG
ncbi:MAG: hypothetical protein NC347_13440 [Clostridium sp.]|nr:hypothetical protein [Clostridium sp.]